MSANRDINLRLKADARGFRRDLRRGSSSVRDFTRRSSREFGRLKKFTSGIGKTIRSAFNPLTATIGGAAITYGVARASRSVMEFDDQILTLGLNAGMTGKEISNLRKEIFSSTYATRKGADETVAAFNDILDKTGQFDFARQAIEGVGKASTAMGANINDVSQFASAAAINLGLAGDEVFDFFNVVATQGNKGSFIFKDLASQAERLLSAAGRLGITKENFAEYGAFIQMARPNFGSAEETSTAVSNIATRLKTQKDKIVDLIGYDPFDNKGNIKDFQQTIKDIVAKGDDNTLFDIFQEAYQAFGVLSREYKQFGRLDSFDKLVREATESDYIMRAFTERTKLAKYQLKQLGIAGSEFADLALAPVIKSAADELREMTDNPKKMTAFREDLQEIASAVAVIGKNAVAAAAGVSKLLNAAKDANEFLHKPFKKGQATEDYFRQYHEDRLDREYGSFSEYRDEKRRLDTYGISPTLSKSLTSDMAMKQSQNNVTVNVQVDKDGNVKASSPNKDTTVKAGSSLPRGHIMRGNR